jgi:hypothetical protein
MNDGLANIKECFFAVKIIECRTPESLTVRAFESSRSLVTWFVSASDSGQTNFDWGNDDFYNCWSVQMYRKRYKRHLFSEHYHVLFGGTLKPDNRWAVLFASLIEVVWLFWTGSIVNL